MIDLTFQKRYVIDLTGQIIIGNIPEMLLYDRLQDGRIMGLLAEDIIAGHFNGLTRTKHNGASADLIKTDCRVPMRIQCKSFKEQSVSVAPSKMKGVGRKFSEQDFDEYSDEIDGWLLIDISSFPKMIVYALDAATAASVWRISATDAKIYRADLMRLTMKGNAP